MLKSFIVILQFLTRLPVNISIEFDRKLIAKGTFFFPFVGMIIGAIAAFVYYLLSFIHLDIAALGAVFTMVAVTGGLHMDGLSDTADGFLSSRPRERILEIMKDSRVGTFGVIAIVFDILFKYVILKNLGLPEGIFAIILSCGIGRLAEAMLFSFGKSARPGGMGDLFINKETRIYFIVSAVLFIIIGFWMAQAAFLMALGVVVIFTFMLRQYSYRMIGGLTGDVYGAGCEIGEIISMFIFWVVKRWILFL